MAVWRSAEFAQVSVRRLLQQFRPIGIVALGITRDQGRELKQFIREEGEVEFL